MAFQVSPGVNVSEIDLTTIVPSISTSDAGFVGNFQWGPLKDITLIENELQLVDRFGKPNDATFVSFLTAANFLSYSDKLRLVRVSGTGSLNASAEATTGSGTPGTGLLVENDAHYNANFAGGAANVGPFIAKHPGALGNSLRVSLCPSADAYSKAWASADSTGTALTIDTVVDHTLVVAVGSIIVKDSTGEERTAVAVSAGTVTLNAAFTADLSNDAITVNWQYKQIVQFTPGTSDYALERSGVNDELNIVVIDEDGKFTGIAGTVLERFPLASKASDAKSHDGSSAYYKDVVNRKSKYVRWTDHIPAGTNWGNAATGTTFTAVARPYSFSLAGGADGSAVTDGQKITGYDLFTDPEAIDVALVIGGEASAAVAVHIIGNVCEARKDCIALLSPPKDAVVDNAGQEAEDIINFRDNLPSSSYAVLDSGWKFQYDKYNDVYRYVPLCGDIAGLCARTDKDRDPWFSPAGLNRGQIKNVTRLAFNPNRPERDDLYLKGVNSVVTFPGEGTVLFGDKTLLAKPSAFDRINVRRLFIVLEKSIAKASRYSLFEFNDEFTRAQFRALVEPYLRDVKGRRGITDFRVVCDSSNNTGEVIDRNEFVGDIYIKPARSINFIQLNFVAVRTGVEFDEIVGKF